MTKRDQYIYRRIFREANGEGPWPCYHPDCDELVQPADLQVHHIDENHQNNNPSNLTAMHSPCHGRLHATGRKQTDAHKQKIADAKRGRPRSAETKQKLSIALTGKPQQKRRYRCGGCELMTTGRGLHRHQQLSEHEGKVPI